MITVRKRKDGYMVTFSEVVGFFRRRARRFKFVGSGTVFREYPSGRRADTALESWLSSIVTAHKFMEQEK